MESVKISFPSGDETFSRMAQDLSGAGVSSPRLLSVSNVYRAVNKEKAFENSSVEVVLDDSSGYFAGKMVSSDRFIKGRALEFYDGDDLVFRGNISRMPVCKVNEFRVVADIKQLGLSAAINWVIKATEFPDAPASNVGQYGNIIAGTADDTGGNESGMCTAYRVGTNLFLAAWHELNSLISVFDKDEVDITSSCTLDDGKKVTDGGLEIWGSATDLTNWTELVAGTSTVNREASEIHAGTYAARFDVDALNSGVSIEQNITLIEGRRYRAGFWYKAPIGATVAFRIIDNGSNVTLGSDGEWVAGTGYIEISGTGAWNYYFIDFEAHSLYSAYILTLSRGSDCASQALYFDNVSVTGYAYISYTSSDDRIYFNAKGFECDMVFNENPAVVFSEMNSRFGSFTIDGVAAAAAIYDDREYSGISIVLSDNTTWAEFMAKFAMDWDALMFAQANGNLKIKVLQWGEETPVASIPEVYIHDYSNWMDIENIVDEYRRMYWYHFRKTFFHRLPQDVSEDTQWEAEADSIDLRYHSDDGTSKDVAAGILFFTKEPAIYYRIKVESSVAKTLELGDVVNIRYDRGYHPGVFRMMQLFKKEKVAGIENYYLEGIDVTEINYGLIYLWDDADPEVYLLLTEGVDADCGVLL